MNKPRTDLIPYDALLIGGKASVADLLKVFQAWWIRDVDRLPPVLPPDMVMPVAAVLGFGAAKYSQRGWEHDPKYHTASGHFASAMRHLYGADELDAESGLPNVWHAVCRYMMTIALQERGLLIDDRPPAAPKRAPEYVTVVPGSSEEN